MSNIELAQPDYETLWKLSQRVHNTPFVPKAMQGRPESVLACVLYGAELGLGPMQSLNSIHVIEGRTAMSPELMRAMVAKHGHRIDVIENSNTVCEVKGIRADTGSSATVRWTMEDAKMAGLAGKNNWKTYPRAMLLARATSELCRIVFPDIIAGLSYTPEEVASIEGIDYIPAEEEKNELPTVEEEVFEDVVDAEIIEAPQTVVVDPTKLDKIANATKMEPVATMVTKVVGAGLPIDNGPSFEERIKIAESWGKWPYVKAVIGVAGKKMGIKAADMPINFHELAGREELWDQVKKIMDSKE